MVRIYCDINRNVKVSHKVYKVFVCCKLPVPRFNPFQYSVKIQETKHEHSSSTTVRRKITVNYIYIFKCIIKENLLTKPILNTS